MLGGALRWRLHIWERLRIHASLVWTGDLFTQILGREMNPPLMPEGEEMRASFRGAQSVLLGSLIFFFSELPDQSH